jgi:hypothetical protein
MRGNIRKTIEEILETKNINNFCQPYGLALEFSGIIVLHQVFVKPKIERLQVQPSQENGIALFVV